jgi:alkylation response protein AidB-like acyl-CoA dehydrogenase
VTAATVPAELGGLGVASLRDHAAGMSRLGRGDGSTAIAMNMHLWRVWMAARAWRAARLAGDAAQEEAPAALLRSVAAEGRIIAVVSSEPGGAGLRPMAEAVRDGEGWRLNSRKAFGTGSPVADLLNVRFRVKDEEGAYRMATALVPADAPGVAILGNWDALGMRASGSHDVVFADCRLSAVVIDTSGVWGEVTPNYMAPATSGVLGLVAVFLGIAEAARAVALERIRARGRGESPGIRHLVAQAEIDLLAARAVVERVAARLDAVFEAHPGSVPAEAMRLLLMEFQAAKHLVTRKAIAVVDHAMTLSGGAGYLSANPLSRLYRDVRAGPFMQPFSPVEALDLIGGIALDLPA